MSDMDVQILYIPSRCFKSHAFYSQAILKIRIDRSCAHLTWKIENGVEMSTISIYGYFRVVLSSLRLMWNIEKPRTHSHTRTCSILIVPMALRFANVSWLDHSSFFCHFRIWSPWNVSPWIYYFLFKTVHGTKFLISTILNNFRRKWSKNNSEFLIKW